MKKITLLLLAICLVTMASAKVLRVNNITGSTATYSTFDAAYSDAKAGDTIMVDPSPTSYGGITIKKKLVILGPGYWLMENGIVQEGGANATFGDVVINAEGSTIKGVYTGDITISTNNVTVMRCHARNVWVAKGTTHGVIHQNFVENYIQGYYEDIPSYYQITNNIIRNQDVRQFQNSYVAYNTSTGLICDDMKNSTIEYNIYKGDKVESGGSNNSTKLNKQITDSDIADFSTYNAIDSDYKKVFEELTTEHGAFAGEDPYVISGVPSGPVIKDISTQTTVEKGDKLNVTINVSIQK
jgi:hypothetical protein